MLEKPRCITREMVDLVTRINHDFNIDAVYKFYWSSATAARLMQDREKDKGWRNLTNKPKFFKVLSTLAVSTLLLSACGGQLVVVKKLAAQKK